MPDTSNTPPPLLPLDLDGLVIVPGVGPKRVGDCTWSDLEALTIEAEATVIVTGEDQRIFDMVILARMEEDEENEGDLG
jgi:hypothetical protein